jgi:hypothetical protein
LKENTRAFEDKCTYVLEKWYWGLLERVGKCDFEGVFLRNEVIGG